MISLKNITKLSAKGVKKDESLLNDISMDVGQGEFVIVRRNSDGGQSILPSILALMERFDFGQYYYKGVDIGRLSLRQALTWRTEHIGFVFSDFGLIDSLTIMENIALPLYYKKRPVKERQHEVERLLELTNITYLKDRFPSQLSKGQVQRVAIARSLSNRPELLVLDEPFYGLDKDNADMIMDLLKEMHALGLTVLMTTSFSEMDTPEITTRYRLDEGRLLHLTQNCH